MIAPFWSCRVEKTEYLALKLSRTENWPRLRKLMKQKAPGLGNVCKMSRQPGACPRNSQNGCLAKVLPSSRPEGCCSGLLPDAIFPSSRMWALVRWSEQTDTNTDIHTCMCRYTHARIHTFHA